MLPLRPCWPGAAPRNRARLGKGDLHGVHGPGVAFPAPKGEKQNHCVGDILEGAGILEAPYQETHLRPMEIHLQGTFCFSAKTEKWNVVAFPLDQPTRQNIGL